MEGLYLFGKPDNFDIMFGDNKLGECLYDDSNAYPFIIAGSKLYIGNSSEGHWDIGRMIANIPYDSFFDYIRSPEERYELESKRDAAFRELQACGDYAAGRIWVNIDADDETLDGSTIISFWNCLDNANVVNGKFIKELLSHFNINSQNVYIAIIGNDDDSFGKLVKYNGCSLHLAKMNGSQKQYYTTHLMNAKNKHQVTSDFRKTRDKAIYSPREKGAGTLAAYNAHKYPYGENKKYNKRLIRITEEDLHQIVTDAIDNILTERI